MCARLILVVFSHHYDATVGKGRSVANRAEIFFETAVPRAVERAAKQRVETAEMGLTLSADPARIPPQFSKPRRP